LPAVTKGNENMKALHVTYNEDGTFTTDTIVMESITLQSADNEAPALRIMALREAFGRDDNYADTDCNGNVRVAALPASE